MSDDFYNEINDKKKAGTVTELTFDSIPLKELTPKMKSELEKC